jgi:hypothetical protein
MVTGVWSLHDVLALLYLMFWLRPAATPAAPLPNNTLWQVINRTATQQQGGSTPVVINILSDASIAEGAPGSPGLQPANTSAYPYQGAWFKVLQASFFDTPGQTRLPAPPGPEAVLSLTRSLVLQSDQGSNSSTIFDAAGLQNMFKLPPVPNGSSSAPPVTLSFSQLTLFNLPPGPFSTFPQGMLTMLMWNIAMDRWGSESTGDR